MIIAAVLIASLAGSPDAEGKSAKPLTDRYVLSIGVNEYPRLGVTHCLEGAVNDVHLITERMKTLGFNDVKTLTNSEATGKAIRDHWDVLVSKLDQRPKDAPPAWVVFHFSGHGSQVPDQPAGDPDHDEKDGLDETIVPSDAAPLDPNTDIRDDDIFHFVERVVKNGRAKILLILDCCHSGSGARGQTRFRIYRREGVRPQQTTDLAAGEIFDGRILPAGTVLLSASRAAELEPEYYDYFRKKSFGLLSCFFDQLLEKERLISKISFSMMRDIIEHHYLEAAGVYSPPTPQVEASPRELLQETFLGLGPDMDRKPYFIVEPEEDGYGKLDAGILQDVTEGSIYRAYSHPEEVDASVNDGSKTIVWLRVAKVDGPISKMLVVKGYALPEATTTIKWPEAIKRLYAVERIHMPGRFVTRVKVVQALRSNESDWSDSAPLATDALPPTISRAFRYEKPPDTASTRSIEDLKEGWLRLVTKADEPADLLLRYSDDYAALLPTTGLAQEQTDGGSRSSAPVSLRGGWGPIDLGRAEAPELIREFLRRITRVHNLMRMADARSGHNLHVRIDLLEVSKESNGIPTEWKLWPRERTGQLNYQPMQPNSLYALRLVNEGLHDVFVTAVVIQPNQQLDVMFPHQVGGNRFDENRLTKGNPIISDVFKCTPPLGSRTVAYLVTDQPHNFSFVQQLRLPVIRAPGLENLQFPPVEGMQASNQAGGGTLGDALLGEMGFRDERVGIPVADPSWASGSLRWLSVEPVPSINHSDK